MSSSILITLIALGLTGGLAFFVSAGFRGSGKVSDYAPNLTKYRTDDDLERWARKGHQSIKEWDSWCR